MLVDRGWPYNIIASIHLDNFSFHDNANTLYGEMHSEPSL